MRGKETVLNKGRAQYTTKATSSLLRWQLPFAVINYFPKVAGGREKEWERLYNWTASYGVIFLEGGSDGAGGGGVRKGCAYWGELH